MATVPVYVTWVDGTVVTGSDLDSQIRDAGNFLIGRPFCDVDSSSSTSLTANTATLISYDTENFDNDGMHSTTTNPSRIICQTLGVFTLHYYWRVSSVSGTQTLNLRLNSGGSSSGGSSLSTTTYTGVNQIERTLTYNFANIGDYVEMFATTSGTGQSASGGNRITGITALWELSV